MYRELDVVRIPPSDDMEFAGRVGTIVEIQPYDEWGDNLLVEIVDDKGKTEGFQTIYDPEVDIIRLHGRWRQFRHKLWTFRHIFLKYGVWSTDTALRKFEKRNR